MKKRLKILIIVSVAAVLFTLAGCEIPDYQLEFEIYYTGTTSPVAVDYLIRNIGWKDMDNAQIRITVESSGGTYREWTPGVDLSIDESISDTVYIYFTGTLESVQVTATGWDEG